MERGERTELRAESTEKRRELQKWMEQKRMMEDERRRGEAAVHKEVDKRRNQPSAVQMQSSWSRSASA